MSETPTSKPRRGEVWLIDCEPQVGHEIGKRRPAVVIGSDEIGRLALRIVVPITEWKDRYASSPWLVHLKPSPGNGLDKQSAADGFQVKSFSLQRFKKKLGIIPRATCEEIAAAVALCIAFSPPPSFEDPAVNSQ
jgi:mRNA interferase MazF